LKATIIVVTSDGYRQIMKQEPDAQEEEEEEEKMEGYLGGCSDGDDQGGDSDDDDDDVQVGNDDDDDDDKKRPDDGNIDEQESGDGVEVKVEEKKKKKKVCVYHVLWTGEHYEPILLPHRVVDGGRYQSWCETCQTGYNNEHRCTSRCGMCDSKTCTATLLQQQQPKGKANKKVKRKWKECQECHRYFPVDKDDTCYNNHKQNKTCQRIWKCQKKYGCRRIIRWRVQRPEEHKCTHKRCVNCKQYKPEDHQCFIQSIQLKEPNDKYLFADCESYIEQGGEHEIGLVVTQDWSGKQTEHDSAKAHVEWLLKKQKGKTVVMHNGGAYDYLLMYKELCLQGKSIKPIYRDAKLIMLTIGQGKNRIRLIDWINFVARALADWPTILGLQVCEVRKGFFPYRFYTRSNSQYVGTLPDRHYFCPESMSKERRDEFDEWYAKEAIKYNDTEEKKEEESNDNKMEKEKDTKKGWNLQAELRAYCTNDVTILRLGCQQFRQLFLDMTQHKCDPFCYTTLAGACMNAYRAIYMPKDSIAYLHPELAATLREALYGGRCEAMTLYWDAGEATGTGSSTMAKSSTTTTTSSTEEKEHGEYRDITSLYPYVNATKRYPVGHPKLIGPFEPFKRYKSQKHPCHQMWKRMKASNTPSSQHMPPIQDVIDKYIVPATVLSIICCDVLCPKQLRHPVLPTRTAKEGKLIFDLCDKQEEWYTSIELKEALKHGYTITKVHMMAIWETTRDDLFKAYVHTFLKIKQEASGWPAWCVGTGNDDDDDEKKQQYLREYEQHQGIKLDANKIATNKGMREVAKLCLNSLWGKFCQSNDLVQTKVFKHGMSEYHAYLERYKATHDRYIVPILLDDKHPILEVQIKPLKERSEQQQKQKQTNDFANVVIGVFTTAYGRMELYRELDRLQDQVLYCDTDSIIYKYDENNTSHKQIAPGEYLGQWKDELEDKYGKNHIVQFVSGGPKNYAYRLERKDDKGRQEYLKVKGINLRSYSAQQVLTRESMKELVLPYVQDQGPVTVDDPERTADEKNAMSDEAREQTTTTTVTTTETRTITTTTTMTKASRKTMCDDDMKNERSSSNKHAGCKRKLQVEQHVFKRCKRQRTIQTVTTVKTYRVVFDKREVQQDYTTLPFGHEQCQRKCPFH
jgi:hypothetical protein